MQNFKYRNYDNNNSNGSGYGRYSKNYPSSHSGDFGSGEGSKYGGGGAYNSFSKPNQFSSHYNTFGSLPAPSFGSQPASTLPSNFTPSNFNSSTPGFNLGSS